MRLVDVYRALALLSVALMILATGFAAPVTAHSSLNHGRARHVRRHAAKTGRARPCGRRSRRHGHCSGSIVCANHRGRRCPQARHTSRHASKGASRRLPRKAHWPKRIVPTAAFVATYAPVPAITGTTYYVSPSGSDSNSGTSPISAWRTVKRVNEASLAPGDGVLFQGGATFSDETLMPETSGTVGSLIVFGSYGTGNATLPKGVWFRGKDDLAFEHLTIESEGNLQGTGSDITVEWCSIGNDSLPINAAGGNSDWTIDDNTIDHAGNSGMLLEGENFIVSGNTITNTGLDASIPYGKHGIYLKVSNATVTNNTITNFSADGISVRYRNSTLTGNHISNGEVGIAWFQYDPIAGTSRWTENTITGTTEAGIYVSPSDKGGETRESFIIEHNTLQPATGVYMNLHPTTGTYTLENNLLR